MSDAADTDGSDVLRELQRLEQRLSQQMQDASSSVTHQLQVLSSSITNQLQQQSSDFMPCIEEQDRLLRQLANQMRKSDMSPGGMLCRHTTAYLCAAGYEVEFIDISEADNMAPGTLLSTWAKRSAPHLHWDGYLAATNGSENLLVLCEAHAYLREAHIIGSSEAENICMMHKKELMFGYMRDIRQQKWASNAAAKLQQEELSRYVSYELKFVTGAAHWETEAVHC
jgi:hypothetical protein